jgi:hypothetical protein
MLIGVVICQSAGEYITEAFGGLEACTPIYAAHGSVWVFNTYVKIYAVLIADFDQDLGWEGSSRLGYQPVQL